MSKVGWIYVGENAAPQDPALLAFWESQPPAGRDLRPAACVRRIRTAVQETFETMPHDAELEQLTDALDDCDELERAL